MELSANTSSLKPEWPGERGAAWLGTLHAHMGEAGGRPLLTPGVPGSHQNCPLAAGLAEVRKQLQKCAQTRICREIFFKSFPGILEWQKKKK